MNKKWFQKKWLVGLTLAVVLLVGIGIAVPVLAQAHGTPANTSGFYGSGYGWGQMGSGMMGNRFGQQNGDGPVAPGMMHGSGTPYSNRGAGWEAMGGGMMAGW